MLSVALIFHVHDVMKASSSHAKGNQPPSSVRVSLMMAVGWCWNIFWSGCLYCCCIYRWKEECNVISRKYESKLSDLRSELSRQKTRSEELTKLLKESRDKTVEVHSALKHSAFEITCNRKPSENGFPYVWISYNLHTGCCYQCTTWHVWLLLSAHGALLCAAH